MKFLTVLFVMIILIVGAGGSHAGDIAKHVDDIGISDVVVYDVENEKVCQDAGVIIGVIFTERSIRADGLDDIIQISKLQEDSKYDVYNYDYDINLYPDLIVLHNQFTKSYRPIPITKRRMHRTQHRL